MLLEPKDGVTNYENPPGWLEEEFKKAGLSSGVDPGLLKTVAWVESGYNARAVSRSGAVGVMQLMSGTARSLGVTDSFDPGQNIDGGARYLRRLLDMYRGDLRLALAAYNAGPARVAKARGVPPEAGGYVNAVIGAFEERKK